MAFTVFAFNNPDPFLRASLCVLYLILVVLFFKYRRIMALGGKGWHVLTLGLFIDWLGECTDYVSVFLADPYRSAAKEVMYYFFAFSAFLILGGAAIWIWQLVSHLKRLEKEILVDPLTKVYNRRYLLERALLQKKKEEEQDHYAVVMIDVDDFKKVNDTYGHLYGDEVLKEVAARLSALIRPDDHLVRYGGDEFLLILNRFRPYQKRDITFQIERVMSSLVLPNGKVVGCSVGLAFYPEDGKDLHNLVEIADRKMYQHKLIGKINLS